MLLVEEERALGARDLEAQVHLAARRNPVRFDRSAAAARESNEKSCGIVDLDLAALCRARRNGTRRDDRLEVGHLLVDRAEKESRHADDMTAKIGDCSGSARFVDPPTVGHLSVGHIILGMNAAKADDLAKFARSDHLPRQPE